MQERRIPPHGWLRNTVHGDGDPVLIDGLRLLGRRRDLDGLLFQAGPDRIALVEVALFRGSSVWDLYGFQDCDALAILRRESGVQRLHTLSGGEDKVQRVPVCSLYIAGLACCKDGRKDRAVGKFNVHVFSSSQNLLFDIPISISVDAVFGISVFVLRCDIGNILIDTAHRL